MLRQKQPNKSKPRIWEPCFVSDVPLLVSDQMQCNAPLKKDPNHAFGLCGESETNFIFFFNPSELFLLFRRPNVLWFAGDSKNSAKRTSGYSQPPDTLAS